MVYQNPSPAIKQSKEKLYHFGQRISSRYWQSVKSPDDTWEILNHSLRFEIPSSIEKLVEEVRPSLPWAEDHFLERISGVPLNPPPSHVNWPFNARNKEQFTSNEKFSHTYPERFWPKHEDTGKIREGIRFDYGDYKDVINLLENDPHTRQAYLPIWFPEDTGVVHGKRVPCTLGYHFIIRNDYLHINYFIRSCDAIRHFRDDIYMACRLGFDIIDTLSIRGCPKYQLGTLSMHIISFHCFYREKELLKK